MIDKIKSIKTNLELASLQLDKKSARVAIFRLIVFFAALVSFIVGFKNHLIILVILGAILAVVFISLVRYHAIIDERILEYKAKVGVLNRYIMRLSDRWKRFEDTGAEFLDDKDTLSRDLDLLGKNSLFQFISIAHTDAGRKKLAESLSLKNFDIKNISRRYEAITELSQKTEFLVDFEALSERIVSKREHAMSKLMTSDVDGEDENGSENNSENSSENSSEKKRIQDDTLPVWMYPLMIIIPLMNIASIVSVLIFDANPIRIIFTFILGVAATWGTMGYHNVIAENLYNYGAGAKDLQSMLKILSDQSFDSELLKKVHERTASRDGLLSSLNSLGTIATLDNMAFNPLVHLILSGFFAWDYFIDFLMAGWNKKNKGVIEECVDIVGDIEELGSLAVLSYVRNTSRPEIIMDNKDLTISFTGLYHPLLNMETVISNDSDIKDKLTIITGSNMSGKTTYMRTIAINMVLAYTGSGICADHFKATFMKLFTSMRVMDDVAGGISTFYAEILRIKEMSEYVSSIDGDVDKNIDNDKYKVPALCLIDEIFKGTNSADRIVGAREALSKLSSSNAMVIVTTHDFELCDITTADGESARNCHFEEFYVGDELKFDYKLREGRCTTRNAMALLKMAGLVQN